MSKKRRIKNPVAKNMEEFNRPATHRDRTKYNRKDKNKGSQDPYFLTKFSVIGFMYNCISIIMLKCLIQFKGDKTGGAWWPVPVCHDVQFLEGYEYKIYDVVYSADTMPFRDACYEALRETTWNAVCEKACLPRSITAADKIN